MLVAVGIGVIAVTGLASGVTFNVDIAIAFGLVGFWRPSPLRVLFWPTAKKGK